jgi:hypothetical protein
MIRLPDFFQKKLGENPILLAQVQRAFAAFEPWLELSGMPFFPGFTDHSPRHINEVLETAASLISDPSYGVISPEDISVLCIAVLLHDCGMHVTPDVFRSLVSDDTQPLIDDIDKYAWKLLWVEYLSEAARFGQDKLNSIFGSATPYLVSEFDIDNLTERDNLLIGEFVRRHHTRFAHEVARVGVRRAGGTPLQLGDYPSDLADLAGLVARSHGMSIRSTFDYLESHYGNVPTYRNVKGPYLMAVLRIADYIQVHSERAIAGLLSVKELISPVSRQEWLNHFSVRDVHREHDDPEAFFVQAAPKDAKTFLRLSYLFKDIQRELDESWATLGEVYGRRGKLASLGLTVRRIRSNLDVPEKFGKTVSYFPVAAKFDTSGPELLKLLVGPLYNYKYEVGIRELLQNAVDACREAVDLMANSSEMEIRSITKPSVLIKVEESDDGSGVVTVTDTGTGMTLETVTKYFLMAGASFRNSDIWKKQHMNEGGEVRITRGGRFGIGALAGFLLGDEISIKTRHITASEKDGIEFTARIDDPVVELKRAEAPIGTTIRISITHKNIINRLRPYGLSSTQEGRVKKIKYWSEVDWFVQKFPPIVRRWSGYNLSEIAATRDGRARVQCEAEFELQEIDVVPNQPVVEPGWTALENLSDYSGVLWRYKPEIMQNKDDEDDILYGTDEVVVNGIRIRHLSRNDDYVKLPEGETLCGAMYAVRRPTMSIYDPAGICPINLQRNQVAFSKMGLDKELARSVIANHLEELSNFMGSKLPDYGRVSKYLMSSKGLFYLGQLSPVFLNRNGIYLSSLHALLNQNVQTLFFLSLDADRVPEKFQAHLNPGEACILRTEAGAGSKASLAWFRAIFSPNGSQSYSYSRDVGAPLIDPISQSAVMSKLRWEQATKGKKVSRYIVEALDFEVREKGRVYATNDLGNSLVKERLDELISVLPDDAELAMWVIEKPEVVVKDTSLYTDEWLKRFKSYCLKSFD